MASRRDLDQQAGDARHSAPRRWWCRGPATGSIRRHRPRATHRAQVDYIPYTKARLAGMLHGVTFRDASRVELSGRRAARNATLLSPATGSLPSSADHGRWTGGGDESCMGESCTRGQRCLRALVRVGVIRGMASRIGCGLVAEHIDGTSRAGYTRHAGCPRQLVAGYLAFVVQDALPLTLCHQYYDAAITEPITSKWNPACVLTVLRRCERECVCE